MEAGRGLEAARAEREVRHLEPPQDPLARGLQLTATPHFRGPAGARCRPGRGLGQSPWRPALRPSFPTNPAACAPAPRRQVRAHGNHSSGRRVQGEGPHRPPLTAQPPAVHSSALPSARRPPTGFPAGCEVSAPPRRLRGRHLPGPGSPRSTPCLLPRLPSPTSPGPAVGILVPAPPPRPPPRGSRPAPLLGSPLSRSWAAPRALQPLRAGLGAEPYFGRWRCGPGPGSPARKGGYSGPGQRSSCGPRASRQGAPRGQRAR